MFKRTGLHFSLGKYVLKAFLWEHQYTQIQVSPVWPLDPEAILYKLLLSGLGVKIEMSVFGDGIQE